jgi:hypothetical protein
MRSVLGGFLLLCAAGLVLGGQTSAPATGPGGVTTAPGGLTKVCDYLPTGPACAGVLGSAVNSSTVWKVDGDGRHEIALADHPYTVQLLSGQGACVVAVKGVYAANFGTGTTRAVWSGGPLRYPMVFNERRSRLAVVTTESSPQQHGVLVVDTEKWTCAEVAVDSRPEGLAFDGDELDFVSDAKLFSVDTLEIKADQPLRAVPIGAVNGQLLAMEGNTLVSYTGRGDLCVGVRTLFVGRFADVGVYRVGDSLLFWGRTDGLVWKFFRIRADRDAELVRQYPDQQFPGKVDRGAIGLGGRRDLFWFVMDSTHMLVIDGDWKPTVVAPLK